MGLGNRLAHVWNAFVDTKPETSNNMMFDPRAFDMNGVTTRPDRVRLGVANERTTIASIYTRISIDVSAALIRHVRVDEDERFLGVVQSGMNYCLNVSANLDQAGRAFRRDMALTAIDKGVCAVVPVDTSLNPTETGGYDINTMRIGHVVKWMPQHVKVSVYNEATGKRQEITLNKRTVAIIENPLYDVMNEPNSTLQRLTRKLTLLDAVDEQSSSGKLDLIIQLPYVVKSDTRKQQAEQRRTDLEWQLKGSQYGIAYTDGTEKITQLNRPSENNLLKQVEWLTEKLYTELGLTPEVMNGTADEKTMLNYHERTIAPILDAIVEELKRKFLTKTAQTRGQSIQYFRDPFKLVPISQIADIADKFTRNEIASSNEIRQAIGMRPSKDPKADELRNSNMPLPPPGTSPSNPGADIVEGEIIEPDPLDEIEKALDESFATLGIDG